MSEFLKKARVPVVAVSAVGLIACGQGREGTSATSTPATGNGQELQICQDGLPRYQKMAPDPNTTNAYLKPEEGAGCKTPMYDPATMQATGEYIGPDTEFWACVPEADSPARFQVTIVEQQMLGATGMVNLSEAATAQLLAAQDIPDQNIPICAQ